MRWNIECEGDNSIRTLMRMMKAGRKAGGKKGGNGGKR